MSQNQTYTIEPLHISEESIAAIHQLVEACEAEEPAPVRISWGMLQERPGDMPLDFCCYLDGRLVGHLFMDHYDPKERETVILVHPAYRRRGIGQALLAAAREACHQAGVERIILICERRSLSGKAFVEHVGAHLDFGEHEMGLGEFQPCDAHTSRLRLRRAEVADQDAMVAILAGSFEDPEELVRERLIHHWHEASSRQYIATVALDGTGQPEPVGVVRLTAEANETGIYGLGVSPAYQRHGYGRQIVEEAIRIARSEDPQQPVMLDVEVENARAISLYLSCGFHIRATYDYYALNVGA